MYRSQYEIADGCSPRMAAALLFMLDTRLSHAHGVWHLFVIAGSATHYVAILRYVL